MFRTTYYYVDVRSFVLSLGILICSISFYISVEIYIQILLSGCCFIFVGCRQWFHFLSG